MVTIALIGPDGSGKSTVTKRLLEESDFPIQRIYMGINREESNFALPTTRFVTWLRKVLGKEQDQGGPRDDSLRPEPTSKNPIKRMVKGVKSGLVLANRIAEEWYRQFVAWYFLRRGKIVLFDRHFYADFYEYDIAGRDRRLTSKIHGYMLEHLYPKPDITIYLDAPAEVLFQRKGEGTVELLEERRQAYLCLRDKLPNFTIIDTTQPLDNVIATIKTHIADMVNSKKRRG